MHNSNNLVPLYKNIMKWPKSYKNQNCIFMLTVTWGLKILVKIHMCIILGIINSIYRNNIFLLSRTFQKIGLSNNLKIDTDIFTSLQKFFETQQHFIWINDALSNQFRNRFILISIKNLLFHRCSQDSL